MSSSSKPYTNTTFTKRIDHDGGAKREPRALAGRAICTSCGAFYENKRWYPKPDTPLKSDNTEILEVECPACKQIREGIFEGTLDVSGSFFPAHRDEIEHLLKNEAEDAYRDNPLSRIIRWDENDAGLHIETTTDELARRLGHVLEKAYHGKLENVFSHENKVVRVNWHRD
ncbi:MAG: BCAM0308 family protein [Acidobacteriota bacterium]|jgi:NMD protein affecting ribosome stability and mRNA decay